MDIYELMKYAVELKASDLHISTGEPPIYRIDGDINKVDKPALTDVEVKKMAHTLMSQEQKKDFEKTLECDFSLETSESRFRINIFMQTNGIAMVLRTIPSTVLSLEELNCPKIFSELANLKKGIVLVTGPTGSGKSTTLAAIIDYINTEKKGHILTIEDPIEFVHKSKKCLINQRQVHKDTLSFNNALRAALREDPDYILVGELRDLETIRLALEAAETGHLVFATLHTSSAPKTIDRVINVFPANEQSLIRTMLAESLQAVIAQVLLKKPNGGRVAAHEILITTNAVSNLIRENKIPQIYSVLQTGRKLGMCTLDDSLHTLVDSKVVNHADIVDYLKVKPVN